MSLLDPPLRGPTRQLAEAVREAGGRALPVGGAVRDMLLGYRVKDVDIEVFGLEPARLEQLLRARFRVTAVGRAFGVLKLREVAIDVSVPRRESKRGTGHKGFLVEADPHLSPGNAARRRDFTVNAISWDPLTGELIDPLDGCADLARGLLRHCSDQFAEDPLRVLRAMQFTARFRFAVAEDTLRLCRRIGPEDLPRERIFEEWAKLIQRGEEPSRGLAFLRESGWVRYYPELEALIGCPQDPGWHPEGDVWTHTLHCMDAFAARRLHGEENAGWENLVVGLAVLCHDMGKPATTFTDEDGRIRSPGHEARGADPARRLLERLSAHRELLEDVLALVTTHMRPAELYKTGAGDSAIRRLARKVVRIDRLVRVAEADMAGRPPMPADFPAGRWLLTRAEHLRVKDAVPEPLIKGRHLIERGMQPGPHFGPILEQCYEAQLEGEFEDEAGGKACLDRILELVSKLGRHDGAR